MASPVSPGGDAVSPRSDRQTESESRHNSSTIDSGKSSTIHDAEEKKSHYPAGLRFSQNGSTSRPLDSVPEHGLPEAAGETARPQRPKSLDTVRRKSTHFADKNNANIKSPLSPIGRYGAAGGRRPSATPRVSLDNSMNSLPEHWKVEKHGDHYKHPITVNDILKVIPPNELLPLDTIANTWVEDSDPEPGHKDEIVKGPDGYRFVIKAGEPIPDIVQTVAQILQSNSDLPFVSYAIQGSSPSAIKHLSRSLRQDRWGRFVLKLSMQLLKMFGEDDEAAREVFITLQLNLTAADISLRGFLSSFIYLVFSMVTLVLSGMVSMGKRLLSLIPTSIGLLFMLLVKTRDLVLAGWKNLFWLTMIISTLWVIYSGTAQQIEDYNRYGFIASAEPQCELETAWTAILPRAVSLVATLILLILGTFRLGLKDFLMLPQPYNIVGASAYGIIVLGYAIAHVKQVVVPIFNGLKSTGTFLSTYPKTGIPALMILLLSVVDLVVRHVNCFSIIAWLEHQARQLSPLTWALIILTCVLSWAIYKFNTDKRWRNNARNFWGLMQGLWRSIRATLPTRDEAFAMLSSTAGLLVSCVVLVAIDRLLSLGITDYIWRTYRSLPGPVQVIIAIIAISSLLYWLALRHIGEEVIAARLTKLRNDVSEICGALWRDHFKTTLAGILLVLSSIDVFLVPLLVGTWPPYGYTGELTMFLKDWAERNPMAASICVCLGTVGLICYYLRTQVSKALKVAWGWIVAAATFIWKFIEGIANKIIEKLVAAFWRCGRFVSDILLAMHAIATDWLHLPEWSVQALVTALLTTAFIAAWLWFMGWTATAKVDIGLIYEDDGSPGPKLRVYQ